jgi:hypothetical protein
LLVAGAPDDARAQDASQTRSYAVVVGSNPGGEGQATLRFAERDAVNMAAVLKDLGGYPAGNVTLLVHPRPAELLAAIDRVEGLVRADQERGLQSVLLFYYSGHAKATALNLGRDDLDLAALRERIEAVPATLKVVILDACQSGAFSGIKGVEPAADFSYNSVARLDAAGVAVMASSSSTELSQESERLGASYFTHHLLVALRGAGDGNRDGKVSLDEAYRYAYHRTLTATAKTAVGRQHVTLETDLKGKGEVPLTYPAKADARLELPMMLIADIVIHNQTGDAVIAELQKARGILELALPRGAYQVLVRRPGDLRQCKVSLSSGRSTTIDPDRCQRVAIADETAKGSAPGSVVAIAEPVDLGRRLRIELGFNGGGRRADGYIDRLADFGYDEDFDIALSYHLAVAYRLTPVLSVVASLTGLDANTFSRRDDTETTRFSFGTHGLAALLRAEYPLLGGHLIPFGEAGAGAVFAFNRVQTGDRPAISETHPGYQLAVAAGAIVQFGARFSLFVRGSYVIAPAMDNLLGDTHDSGGTFIASGFGLSF